MEPLETISGHFSRYAIPLMRLIMRRENTTPTKPGLYKYSYKMPQYESITCSEILQVKEVDGKLCVYHVNQNEWISVDNNELDGEWNECSI